MAQFSRCQVLLILALVACGVDDSKAAAEGSQAILERARSAYLAKDYSRSEELYLLALQELGGKAATSAEFADVLDALCIVYNAQNRYAETEALYRRAYHIREKLFGPKSIQVAESLSRLAGCYHSLGRLDDSITLQTRAVAIVEGIYGGDHERVASALQSLSRLYNLHRNHVAAEQSAMRALKILEQKFGPDAPQLSMAFMSVGAAYLGQRRFDEAENAYVKAVRLSSPSDSIAMAAFHLNNLAFLYRRAGKLEKAERLHLIGLEALESAYGSNSPCLLSTLQAYGIVLTAMQRHAEATAVSERMRHISTANGQHCRP